MRRQLTVLIAVVVAIGGLSIVPQSADATVPGALGRIVFVSLSDDPLGDIYTRSFGGGAWQRLTSSPSAEVTPSWSPDGSEIVYASNVGGSLDIWMMSSDGSNQRNITNDPGNCFGPEFSPDGTRIAYTRTAADGTYSIWVVNANGSGKTSLTSGAPGDNSDPSWSPDGSKIAFSSMRTAQKGVYVMDADGSNVTARLSDVNEWSDDPSWSPDGSKIAYVSIQTGTTNISTMNVDGSGIRKITDRPPADTQPAWSPNGHHVMFVSQADGDYDLWMVDPDGSNIGHLTNHGGAELYGAWESVNRPPIAVDDMASVPRGGAVKIEVLANDSDPDGDRLMLESIVASPKHGAITNKWVTAFVYEHDGSAAMSDSFTYRAKDTRSGVSNVATVSITVGKADTVGLVDPGSGVWRLRNSSGVVSQFYYGDPGDYPFVGDWDCNTVDTPGLYRQSDGFAYLRNSNSQGIADLTFFFGNPGDVPLAGDFNGDGCDTLSIYRPSEARFYIINALGANGGGLGAADYSFVFGDPGDKPVVGDWDGDGIDEVGLHRESTGFFYYRNSLTTGIADGQFFFGDPGDRFVAGDWGVVDGVDTPGLFRSSDLTFYFRHTLTQGNADSQFTWTGAGTGWLPVAGNFNLG